MKYTESLLARRILNKSASKGIPVNGTFELSPECNFSCRMCYVRKTKKEIESSERGMMTLEDWMKLAEQCREQGMLFLLLTGGEPLLWPDFWTLYESLSKMGFMISVNTNGSLIDEKVIERWKEYPPTRVNLTLYGASDEAYYRLCGVKGVYERVKRNIRLLKDAGISVKLNCSLTPENISDLADMVRFAEEEKLILSATTYMFPPIRRDAEATGTNQRFTPEEAAKYHIECKKLQYSEEHYERFLKNLLEKAQVPEALDDCMECDEQGHMRCRAGRSSFWVSWDGYMMPCGMMPIPKVDLKNMSFSDAWQQIKIETSKICVSGKCDHCKNHDLCHACAAMAVTETGKTEDVPIYLCQMVDAMKKIAQEESNRLIGMQKIRRSV